MIIPSTHDPDGSCREPAVEPSGTPRWCINRRGLGAIIAAGIAAPAVTRPAFANVTPDLEQAIGRYLALPGMPAFRLHVGANGKDLRLEHKASTPLFIASAFKTFVLAQFLRDVEAARLSEDMQLTIDDSVRNIGSPVFIDLAGHTPAVSVLEAMMSHSDNMATDAAMLKVGANRVRALIAAANLPSVRIPDSTRILASYLFGAPYGVDIGWKGIQKVLEGHLPGTPRSPYNDKQTILANARDMVAWYEQVLAGTFFSDPATLIEFKRIHSTSIQIPKILPPGRVAYVKGGEADNLFGFFAKSMAGQMLINESTPVTFCFLVNWANPDGTGFKEVQAEFFAAIMDILKGVRRLYSRGDVATE